MDIAAEQQPADEDLSEDELIAVLNYQLSDVNQVLDEAQHQSSVITEVLNRMGSNPPPQPAPVRAVGACASSGPVVSAKPQQLQELISAFNAAGPHQDTVYISQSSNFSVGKQLFPAVPGTGTHITGMDVHVTLPFKQLPSGSSAAAAPVVFFFNCFAMGKQRCSWYSDYAQRLASWGYAVVQFHVPGYSSLNEPDTQYVVDCLMAWIASAGGSSSSASANPQPDFDAAVCDFSRRAFVGHSKGGCDAACMLARCPAAVTATAVLLDGVDTPFSYCGRTALQNAASSSGSSNRKMALLRAEVTSSFNFASVVDSLLEGAVSYCGADKVAAVVVANAAHFTFVSKAFLTKLRKRLQAAHVPGMILDTNRAFHTGEPGARAGDLGVFDQTAGAVVSWLHSTFGRDNGGSSSAPNWSAVLGKTDWRVAKPSVTM